jgi:hypothetical protein
MAPEDTALVRALPGARIQAAPGNGRPPGLGGSHCLHVARPARSPILAMPHSRIVRHPGAGRGSRVPRRILASGHTTQVGTSPALRRRHPCASLREARPTFPPDPRLLVLLFPARSTSAPC